LSVPKSSFKSKEDEDYFLNEFYSSVGKK
jgi:hypothetical protein